MCVESNTVPARDYEKYDVEFDALPFERTLEKYRRRRLIEILKDQLSGDFIDVLEIGPGYNSVLGDLDSSGTKVIIEPSMQLFSYNQSKYIDEKNVNIYNESIRDFSSRTAFQEFDLIILSSVLHEFSDARAELSLIHKLMKKGGNLLIVVPNNESIHRQFGVTLGILESTSTLTSTEHLMQQNQNFSINTLNNFVNEIGFITRFVTTSFIKPHTHSQMQDWIDSGLLDDDGLENLYKLSSFFHPFNSEIFLIATK